MSIVPLQPKSAFSVDSLNALSYPTPFLLCDLKKVEANYTRLQKFLPDFSIFYAVKANSDPAVLKALAADGSSFEVASVNELKLLISLGITADRVMYSNPVKPGNHIREAFELGLNKFVFDSVAELEKLSKFAPGSLVYLRFRTHDEGSVFPLSKKFGAEPQDIIPLMCMARDLGFQTYGLMFHVGSQSFDPHAWEVSIKVAGDAMKELQSQGIEIQMLDVGGGFPADYGVEDPPMQQIGQTIKNGVEAYIPYPVKLVAEPGRAMVAEACVMVTSVIGRVVRSGKNWLYLDIGAFNGMMETLESGNTFKYPIATSRDTLDASQDKTNFTLTGPTCDSQDTMFYDIPLPRGTMTDDRIYIYSAGAYTTMYASFFNGFEPPKVYYVDETKSLARKEQAYASPR